DRQPESACAPQTIADLPKEHAPDGAHEIPGGENTEGVDEPGNRIVGGKELRADERCEVTEHSEVVPLEEIADAAGQRCPKSDLLHLVPPQENSRTDDRDSGNCSLPFLLGGPESRASPQQTHQRT